MDGEIKAYQWAVVPGGGSSNAAAGRTGLNKLWKLNVTENKLAGLAAKLVAMPPSLFIIVHLPKESQGWMH